MLRVNGIDKLRLTVLTRFARVNNENFTIFSNMSSFVFFNDIISLVSFKVKILMKPQTEYTNKPHNRLSLTVFAAPFDTFNFEEDKFLIYICLLIASTPICLSGVLQYLTL